MMIKRLLFLMFLFMLVPSVVAEIEDYTFYLPFDETNFWSDMAGDPNGQYGHVVGGDSEMYNYGWNGSIDFEGDSYIRVDRFSTMPTAFSSCLWINYSGGDSVTIMDKDVSASDGFKIYMKDGSKPTIYADDDEIVQASTAVGDDDWHLICMNYESNTWNISVDGVWEDSETGHAYVENTDGVTFASDHGQAQYFPGELDEVFILDRVMTSAELTEYWNSGVGVRLDETTFYNETETWYYNDMDMMTSQGSDAPLGSGVFSFDAPNNHPIGVPGIIADGSLSAMNFIDYEKNTYAMWNTGRTGDVAAVTGYPMSFNAWVLVSNEFSDANEAIVSVGAGSSFYPYIYLGIDSNGKAVAVSRMAASGGLSDEATSTTSIDDKEWHMITAVYASTTSRKIYVDGVLEDTATVDIDDVSCCALGTIGSNSDNNADQFFEGDIQDVTVYESALDDGNVTALYQGGSPTVLSRDVVGTVSENIVFNDSMSYTKDTGIMYAGGGQYTSAGGEYTNHQDMTISMWLFRPWTLTRGQAWSKVSGSAMAAIDFEPDNSAEFYLYDGSGVFQLNGDITFYDYAPHGYHNYLITQYWDGAKYQYYLYCDGVQCGQTNSSGSYGIEDVNANDIFGTGYDNRHWWGIMDDFRVYDRVLTAGEITDVFTYTQLAESSPSPTLTYVSPTPANESGLTVDYFTVNVTLTIPGGEENITFTLYNSTLDAINTSLFTDSTREITYTGLINGVYYYYDVIAFDTLGENGSTSLRQVTVDTTFPLIEFVSPTDVSGLNINRTPGWVFANVTVVEANFANITFNLYDSGGSVENSTTFTDATRQLNWTGLSDDFYYYNVTVFDSSGNSNSTETRNITIGTFIPQMPDSVSPVNNTVVFGSADLACSSEMPGVNFYQFGSNMPIFTPTSDGMTSSYYVCEDDLAACDLNEEWNLGGQGRWYDWNNLYTGSHGGSGLYLQITDDYFKLSNVCAVGGSGDFVKGTNANIKYNTSKPTGATDLISLEFDVYDSSSSASHTDGSGQGAECRNRVLYGGDEILCTSQGSGYGSGGTDVSCSHGVSGSTNDGHWVVNTSDDGSTYDVYQDGVLKWSLGSITGTKMWEFQQSANCQEHGPGDSAGCTSEMYFDNITERYFIEDNSTAGTATWDLGVGEYGWQCRSGNTFSNWTDPLTLIGVSFYNCTDGSPEQALNYTIRDEQNESVISGDLDINLFFSGGNEFLSPYTDQTNFAFCLAPVGYDVTITSGILEYGATDTSTYPFNRNYFYTDAVLTGGTVSDTTLYLLKGSTGTATAITVLKDGLSLNTGVLRAYRYNTGTGNYNLVAMSYVSDGSTSMDLQHTDATYKFEVYESGVLLCTVPDVTAGGLVISGSTTLNCVTTSTTTTWWPTFIELRDTGVTFNYVNATSVASLTYTIPSGVASDNCFRIVKWEGIAQSQEYYTCSSSAGGTFQHILTDFDANYDLQYVVKLVNTTMWITIASEELKFETYLYDHIGDDSVLLSLIIILLLGMMGLSISAAASISGVMAGLIFVWYFGILEIAFVAVAGLCIGGAYLISRLMK